MRYDALHNIEQLESSLWEAADTAKKVYDFVWQPLNMPKNSMCY